MPDSMVLVIAPDVKLRDSDARYEEGKRRIEHDPQGTAVVHARAVGEESAKQAPLTFVRGCALASATLVPADVAERTAPESATARHVGGTLISKASILRVGRESFGVRYRTRRPRLMLRSTSVDPATPVTTMPRPETTTESCRIAGVL